MRRFFLVTHRWLGLAAAIVLAIAGVTGAILVWNRSEALAFFHTHLALGEFGEWLVNGSAIGFLLLAVGGFVLWWRRKIVWPKGGRGWWRYLFDLHHALGVLGLILTLVIAGSGIGIMIEEEERDGGQTEAPVPTVTEEEREKDDLLFQLHTARELPFPLQLLWAAASLSFVIQAASGFVMWWKPQAAKPNDA